MKQKLLYLLLMVFIPMAMMAYDCEVDGIYYNLVKKAKTASVTCYAYDSYYNPRAYSASRYTIPSSIEYEGETYIVTSIGSKAFIYCKNLYEIILPESITSIEELAFHDCSLLTIITIPNNVTSIGNTAFWGCTRLQSITIPNNVTSIGNNAFLGCTHLQSITIPNSVTSIGEGAFADCSGLTSIDVESGNTTYDSRNNCNAIIETSSNILINGCASTVIPSDVTGIANSAFSGCTGLTSVNIPNSVTSIGGSAFNGCSNLTDINIPNGIRSIQNRTFSGCSSLKYIYIPESVQSIEEYAFHGCSELTSIEIPMNVSSIGKYAFCNCGLLEYVTCYRTTVPNTNVTAFQGSDVEYATLIVPDASLSAYQTTAPWSNFGTILPMSQAAVVTANSYTREYGDPNPTFEYTCATTLNGTPTITCAADATSAPGTYPITISQGTVTNTGLFFVNGTLNVTKAPVTITANSYTIKEGDALPTFEATYTGLKNSETEAVLSPVISCATADSTTPGTYDINVTATSDNYNITIVKGTLTILPTKMEITIGSTGMATYCSAYDLDFSGITDFKACIATGYNSTTGNVIMQPVKDAPAGTGLYLQGTPGTYDVPCGESGSYYVNLLVGTTAPTTISPVEEGFKNLILYNGASGVGFYTIANDYTVGANKAYLQLPATLLGGSAGANRVGVEFEENLDGIENIDMSVTSGAVWYSLDGRQLNGKPTQKGIYVVNGRKVVIK